MTHSRVDIVCNKDTRAHEERVATLSDLRSGDRARVDTLFGGAGFRSRLAALGFTPGAEVRMLQNYGRGPVIVNIRDTRIALGRGEAKRVRVLADGSIA